MSDNSAPNALLWSRSRGAMVIAEKSTQTLAAANGDARTRAADAFDEFVAESLTVAFAVVVGHELREGTPQVPITKRDQAVQAFLFDRANKRLRMRVAIRRATGCLDHPIAFYLLLSCSLSLAHLLFIRAV